MFGMLRGVTEVVSGVTVTVEDHEIMSLGVRPGHCLLMTISPLIGCYLPISGWHQASHWTIISGSGHSLNTLDQTLNLFILLDFIIYV